jgi:arylsulfatase A-like enzyme
VFLWADPRRSGPALELPTQQIRDVAPTVLEHLGLPIPAHVQGRPIPLG